MSVQAPPMAPVYDPTVGFQRRQRRRLITGLIFSSPFWIGMLLFVALPMIASMYLSFTSYDALQPPVYIGTDNYVQLPQDPALVQSLINTVIYAVASVPLNVILGLLVAILLNQKIKGIAAWRSIFYLPAVTPVIAYGILWKWLLSQDYGVINAVLGLAGVKPIDWLGDPRWILVAFVMSGLFSIGGAMIVNLAGLQGIPTELYDAAKVDGATGVRTLISITLPMLSPVIFYNVIMGIVGAMQSFSFFFVLTQGWGNTSYSDIGTVFMTYLYRVGWQSFQMGYAAAMAWLLFVIILVLTLVVFRTSRHWVYYEGDWLTGR